MRWPSRHRMSDASSASAPMPLKMRSSSASAPSAPSPRGVTSSSSECADAGVGRAPSPLSTASHTASIGSRSSRLRSSELDAADTPDDTPPDSDARFPSQLPSAGHLSDVNDSMNAAKSLSVSCTMAASAGAALALGLVGLAAAGLVAGFDDDGFAGMPKNAGGGGIGKAGYVGRPSGWPSALAASVASDTGLVSAAAGVHPLACAAIACCICICIIMHACIAMYGGGMPHGGIIIGGGIIGGIIGAPAGLACAAVFWRLLWHGGSMHGPVDARARLWTVADEVDILVFVSKRGSRGGTSSLTGMSDRAKNSGTLSAATGAADQQV
mmetsp:Transcript_39131/g.84223  ORF Transcript_39131/g.84223 Transcript_39131/m.84223 type:complete len:326 (+) Transcript_39131:1289-2266(+)